jgi:hypothetical protein
MDYLIGQGFEVGEVQRDVLVLVHDDGDIDQEALGVVGVAEVAVRTVGTSGGQGADVGVGGLVELDLIGAGVHADHIEHGDALFEGTEGGGEEEWDG